ncbi:phospholipase A2 inhibitor gamma subunit B-like [Hyla sarda]|uniref:phospholipase A2 inhibitor gamma subunit B-like n=1 Tax=Hyla sarda TaxID=327740 RepID=UPI0024C27E94|nr:phospholipase A2 inhibitor gamma subunit B-like [Hyla sarda]
MPNCCATVSPLTFVRGCGYSEGCTDVVVLRTPYSRSVTISRCCKSDLCTPETPTALPEAPKNDLSCPGCFQITPDSCEGYITVQCRGNEVQCFSFNQLQLYDNITLAMAGCATKTACNLNLKDDKQKNLCTGGIISGAGGLYSSLLLLTAALLITSI